MHLHEQKRQEEKRHHRTRVLWSIVIGGLLNLGLAGSTHASGVVKWVDADGVVHFSQPHLAQGPATNVEVPPANGMDKAEYRAPARGSGKFKLITKAGKKTKDGWQGYNYTERERQRRYRR